MNIGIIGQGFVGSAIREGLKDHYSVLTYDLDETKCNSTHLEVCTKSDIIFACVPTPMRKDGVCDTRILESVIDDLVSEFDNTGNYPIIVIKSTVAPGTTERLTSKYLRICFSPEFLTEANSFNDFKNQTRIILGGDSYITSVVKDMFKEVFPQIPIIETKSQEAEMIKYFTNCFLATKVIFANQMYDICEASNIDYNEVVLHTLHDKRIGSSHLRVPGPDGDRGFGGHCFPKDLAAMIAYANKNGADDYFLKAVEIFNRGIRTNRDWEKMKGRAISDD